jgi:ribonuclease I
MSSIIPDDEVNYDLDKIKFAIKRAVKFEPEVVCYMSNDIQYIVEMDICLSKNFQAVECATKSSFFKQSEQSCRQGVPVRYPKLR